MFMLSLSKLGVLTLTGRDGAPHGGIVPRDYLLPFLDFSHPS